MPRHGLLTIEQFIDPMFAENGYVVSCADGPDCWIIDPGFPPVAEEMAEYISERGLSPASILLTHAHLDHIAGVTELRERFGDAAIIAPRAEAEMLLDPVLNLSAGMGLPVTAPPADQLLDPGDKLRLGKLDWLVLDVAGHSPGGLAYHCAAAGIVLTGDSLLAGSIGRYDFPGSSGERLLANIADNLLTLPDETALYSGHGPPSTIGHERHTNPMLVFS